MIVDRYPLDSIRGGRYYVRRPDWAGLGRLLGTRLLDATALAAVGAAVLELVSR